MNSNSTVRSIMYLIDGNVHLSTDIQYNGYDRICDVQIHWKKGDLINWVCSVNQLRDNGCCQVLRVLCSRQVCSLR